MYRAPLYWQITYSNHLYVFYKEWINQIAAINMKGDIYLWNHHGRDTKPLLKNLLQNDNWTHIRVGSDYETY